MKIKVKFFSIIKDYVGTDEVTFEFSNNIKLSELLEIIKSKWPSIRKLEDEVPIIALVNGSICQEDLNLKDGDEVAIIPPVSGG